MMPQRMRWASLMLALVLATPGARGADEKVTGDLKAMQGEWVPVGGDAEDSTWEIKGQTLNSKVSDRGYVAKMALKEKEQPPAIDFEIVDGPDDVKGKIALAIYKLEGDNLTFCVSLPGRTERPTEFQRVEDQQFVIKLKRK